MTILGIITARGGSQGIPGKNIKKLGGKELIAYTIEAAKKSKLVTDLIVSTDDEGIADVARQYGADVPFMRPKELAEDSTPHVPVLQHAVKFFEEKSGSMVDYIVVFQPTSPFRMSEDIDKTLEKLMDTGADSAVSLVEVEENHPVKIKRLDGDRVLSYSVEEVQGTRRQDLPKAYKRSGAVYAMKRATIMDKGMMYGDYVVGHIVPVDRSIDIDSPFDWVKAEYMLEKLRENGYEF